MGARGRHVTVSGGGCARSVRGAMAGTGDDGSWVELRYGPGCPEPAPSPFSCHADVERMLLEAQLETESGDGALLVLDAPAWDDSGAGQASEQSGESEVLPAHSQPPPGCPHPQGIRWRKPSGDSDSCQRPWAGPVPAAPGTCLQTCAVEPAGRCSGEEEETFQFRAAAALHPLAAAQPPPDPGAGDLHWEAPGSHLGQPPVRSPVLPRSVCRGSPAPAQPDRSQAPCLWHEVPPRVPPVAPALGADPPLPRRQEPADSSTQPQAAPALPSPWLRVQVPCNTDCKYD
ncbi:WAS/WASL-interacting protein family member 1-like isoform X1 [Manacus candei]|uniref:WAS/WASL-interacting protein family member 1-like isoform X1 n=1 Tax=Manacus candei TaxID=415023 RepID=UPI002226F2AC|nr:WAS/WASL-interacting protein family member 1-like isoform X1 [Manacus candei]